jgi:hypothetical protein
MVGPLPGRAVQDSGSSRLQRSEGQAGLTNNPECSLSVHLYWTFILIGIWLIVTIPSGSVHNLTFNDPA